MRFRTALIACAFALSACHGGARPVVTPAPVRTSALEQLRHDLDALVNTSSLDRGTWAVAVRSLTSNEDLYAFNQRKLLMPASNMKIPTLAAAAERLGWDYTFETRLSSTATLQDGVLTGDLIVTGTGDPSIDDWDGAATKLFQGWASDLTARGVHAVAGRLIGDDRAFANEPYGAGWAWDDLDRSYGTAVGALQFNENTARLSVAPGAASGEPATVTIQQPGTGLTLQNALTTGAAGKPLSFNLRRLAGSPVLQLFGSIPSGMHPFPTNVSVVNPTLYFVTALRDGLVASGIDVRGPATDIDEVPIAPASGVALVTHRSPRLADLALTMMKNSQNLYAETLLRAIGGTPATLESARRTELEILNGWGVSADEIANADGSGLSRAGLITAEAIVKVLAHVDHDDRLRGPFERSLPVAGVDGTLRERMKGTAAENNVRAKTGSFTNARAIAGFLQTADNERLVFSVIANNYGTPADVVDRTEDAIVIRLAQFTRR